MSSIGNIILDIYINVYQIGKRTQINNIAYAVTSVAEIVPLSSTVILNFFVLLAVEEGRIKAVPSIVPAYHALPDQSTVAALDLSELFLPLPIISA